MRLGYIHVCLYITCSRSELGSDFWIGYHLNETTAEWTWYKDEFTNYTNFAVGYPEFERCARTSVNGLWKDRDCDSLLPYVCEKPAGSTNFQSKITVMLYNKC